MSADPNVEMPEEETGEVEEIDFKPRLIRMIYNQPTILYYLFEVLFELLEARGVMKEGDADAVIREAVKRWRDEGGEG